ncbi:hypothetical protein [Glycomyces buryatensis]|uniref:Uncharacterized protein n=1 Tax=Glycomyces buryatensis TaxID=2570927 RepID=A0A4S8QIA0_9ACTN|nr:hypothetical protein [Glycomyces buryatensis]THV42715.1 hypothetical protein FAB82_04840 [Glycomyces buryatensis]
MLNEDNDYPDIRAKFAHDWNQKARRYLPEDVDIKALKRVHDKGLNEALRMARDHDKGIRAAQAENGGTASDQFTAGVDRRNKQRDARQGYKGNDVLTPKVLDRFTEDVEAYGRPTKKTLDRVTDRLNAQFPSESSIYPQQSSGAIAAAVALMAGKRQTEADNADR